MQFEKLKSAVKDNALAKAVLEGPMKLMEKFRMPNIPTDLPGRMMNQFRGKKP